MKAKSKALCCFVLSALLAGVPCAHSGEAPEVPASVIDAGADAAVFTAAERLPEVAPAKPQANPDDAYVGARAASWLRALYKAAVSLPDRRDIRLAALNGNERLALAAQIYVASVQPPEQRENLPHVIVTLQPGPALPEDMTAALRSPELLLLWHFLIEETRAALENNLPDSGSGTRAALTGDRARTLRVLWQVREVIAPTPEGLFVRAGALPLLEKAARLAPQSPVTRLALAEAQLQQGLAEQCVSSCGEALRLKPDLHRARYVRALALMRLRQFALAEDDLNALMARAVPAEGVEVAGRLRTRGAIRLLRGNYKGMCEDFVAACGLGDCAGLAEARNQGHCRSAAP